MKLIKEDLIYLYIQAVHPPTNTIICKLDVRSQYLLLQLIGRYSRCLDPNTCNLNRDIKCVSKVPLYLSIIVPERRIP